MINLRKNKTMILKNQIVNSFMENGKKHTGEKILLKVSKSLQKLTQKSFKSLVHSAVTNLTPAFKLNEQIMKKGKRKSKKITPSFIAKDSLRVMSALKAIKHTSQKDKSSRSFYEKISAEVLDASSFKGAAAEEKMRLQNQVLLNKRYLSKFRW